MHQPSSKIGKVIIVVMFSKESKIGGHILSSLELANNFAKNNTEVFLFVNKDLPLLNSINPNIKVIDDQIENRGFWGLLKRGKILLQTIKKFNIDLIITFDKVTCYHAALPATILKKQLLPILPGGNGYDFYYTSPLKLEKTLVFSSEIKDKLISRWNFKPEQIIVNASRFSFETFHDFDYQITQPLKIGYITGMRSEKLISFSYFLEQLESVDIPFEVEIIGDGIDMEKFKKAASLSNQYDKLQFIGYQGVTNKLLRQYSLIVTMGRGVIESISNGVPVAISGENGYKGLVVHANFNKFSMTNFTGRKIEEQGSLIADIQTLSNHKNNGSLELNSFIRKNYDIKNLHKEIVTHSSSELIPYKGNPVVAFLSILSTTMNKKK